MNHGVAVTALGSPEAFRLFLQCECGWAWRFDEVTTADAITDKVAQHRQEAGSGKGSER